MHTLRILAALATAATGLLPATAHANPTQPYHHISEVLVAQTAPIPDIGDPVTPGKVYTQIDFHFILDRNGDALSPDPPQNSSWDERLEVIQASWSGRIARQSNYRSWRDFTSMPTTSAGWTADVGPDLSSLHVYGTGDIYVVQLGMPERHFTRPFDVSFTGPAPKRAYGPRPADGAVVVDNGSGVATGSLTASVKGLWHGAADDAQFDYVDEYVEPTS